MRRKSPEQYWKQFAEHEKLSTEQLKKFKLYYSFLIEQNKEVNLTAITQLKGILQYHFSDSLIVRQFIDFQSIKRIVDVGSGAGFPAVPLKIVFPHLEVILIEPKKKKQQFLHDLIERLEFCFVEVCPLDWRTFLRKTDVAVDLFVTRAALSDVELSRLFRNTSPYRSVPMIYWAGRNWGADPKISHFIRQIYDYRIHYKDRKLVFMSLPTN